MSTKSISTLIGVIRDIKEKGNEVVKAEVVFSDLTNRLISQYDGDKTFSELVITEKNSQTREEELMAALSGADIAGKCMILAKECGFESEKFNIYAESLVPKRGYDLIFNNLYANAIGKGRRLRYVAKIKNGSVKISLQAVKPSDPLFSSEEPKNCIVVTTRSEAKLAFSF